MGLNSVFAGLADRALGRQSQSSVVTQQQLIEDILIPALRQGNGRLAVSISGNTVRLGTAEAIAAWQDADFIRNDDIISEGPTEDNPATAGRSTLKPIPVITVETIGPNVIIHNHGRIEFHADQSMRSRPPVQVADPEYQYMSNTEPEAVRAYLQKAVDHLVERNAPPAIKPAADARPVPGR